MRGADVVQHKIAASNPLAGAIVFLSLALPPDWDITLGAGRPEVSATHLRNGERWVATGDAWYILHNSSRRWAMEIRLTAKPLGRARTDISVPDMTVAGHPVAVSWKERRRGFFKRWPVTYVTLRFDCPVTDRRLRLELSGRAPEEAFREILDASKFVRCH